MRHILQTCLTKKTEFVPFKKLLERPPVGKTCSSYTNVLLEPKIFHLMFDSVAFPVMRFFGLIWFNAADVMWSTLHQFVYQLIGLSLKQTGPISVQLMSSLSCWSVAALSLTGWESSQHFATPPLRRNSIPTTSHYPDQSGASDWLKFCFNQSEAPRRVVTRDQYGISALVPQTSFHEENNVGVARKFRLHHLHKNSCGLATLLLLLDKRECSEGI